MLISIQLTVVFSERNTSAYFSHDLLSFKLTDMVSVAFFINSVQSNDGKSEFIPLSLYNKTSLPQVCTSLLKPEPRKQMFCESLHYRTLVFLSDHDVLSTLYFVT